MQPILKVLLWPINSLGPILAAAILVAAIVAFVLCLRAKRRATSLPAARWALIGSLLPLAASVAGVIFGIILVASQNGNANWEASVWPLAKCILVGSVVSFAPLVWSRRMLQQRQQASA